MDLGEFLQAWFDAIMNPGDQFELRFAEIGGDVGVAERRAEGRRMRRIGKHAVGPDAQAFFFYAALQPLQHPGLEGLQSFMEMIQTRTPEAIDTPK
jgi:hypothetical protein